ncbi:unnamed protein product [Anisakis simplex]|uniref:Transmembrane protein 208 n=1 Tax=Anisakis simplex TaxID=6269 RepID=A0A0M3IYL1_ANISI|nr:unnamed protein product [Anisakis simplex]
MSFNPNYEEIGNAFVQHYYSKFDVPDVAMRSSGLSDLYDPQNSYMTFEGVQARGRDEILQKFTSLTFKGIQRAITKTDCQPLPDGSILVAVIGQLKYENSNAVEYHSTRESYAKSVEDENEMDQSVEVEREKDELQTDDDPVQSYNQFFILRPSSGAFFISNEIFRLGKRMSGTQKAGKVATKGQKRIYEDNTYAIRDYSIAAIISSIFYASLSLTIFSASTLEWVVFCVCIFLQLGAVLTMRYMAQCIRNEKGQVIDAGIDLNQPDAFGEYCKDIVILCSSIVVIATFWSKIFWLLLLIPAYACYRIWTGILSPWFFAQPDDDDEIDEKKLRKKERKLRKA